MTRAGRVVEPRGYVLIRVGKGHHLADCRGYAYEHRLVAEQKLGRRLMPGELVHHDDEIKGNNAGDNLGPTTRPEHAKHHNPRLGTAKPTCKHGHLKVIQPSGKCICRICANAAEWARYHARKGIPNGNES
jgi:hypothetical protein